MLGDDTDGFTTQMHPQTESRGLQRKTWRKFERILKQTLRNLKETWYNYELVLGDTQRPAASFPPGNLRCRLPRCRQQCPKAGPKAPFQCQWSTAHGHDSAMRAKCVTLNSQPHGHSAMISSLQCASTKPIKKSWIILCGHLQNTTCTLPSCTDNPGNAGPDMTWLGNCAADLNVRCAKRERQRERAPSLSSPVSVPSEKAPWQTTRWFVTRTKYC